MKTLNTYVIPSLTHSLGVISLSQTDLESIKRIIRPKIPKACTYHKSSCSKRFLPPRSEGSFGNIGVHNLHSSQVRALRTYLHHKKSTSHLHRIICETGVNYTPLNLHDPQPPSPMTRQPLVGQGFLIVQTSRSHSDRYITFLER